jgi:NAD(P)-dependent dehydrogenase (short-subunit alcohol dehydrogenase family)
VIDESIQAIVDFIDERYGRLDILINNATGDLGKPVSMSAADLPHAREVFDVTVFGTWRLIQATLPLIRKSAAPRIVNISSAAGSHEDSVQGLTSQLSMDPAYGLAKAALNAVTAKLATELRDTPIKINAVCPGFTATRPSMAALGARPVPDSAKGIVWAATLDEEGPSGGFYRDAELQAW